MNVILVLIIPFMGTALGAFMCFFMKNKINKKVEKALLGFASGVMIAASIWSLIIPSIDMAKEQGKFEWLPASVGFLTGILFLLLLDSIIPHLHLNSKKPEGIKAKLKNTTMMILAVTLHNIPEGMAVRSDFGRSITRKYWNNTCRSFGIINRYSHTKLSRRCNYFYAIKSRRNV